VVSGLVFNGCWTSSCTGTGIIVANVSTIDGLTFLGHSSLSNGQQGALINGGKNIKFVNCTIAGNSSAANGGTNAAADGIMIQNTVTNFLISGCRIGQAWGQGNSQRAAIFVNSTTCDYYQIINNDLTTNNNAAMLVDNGTSANRRIENNFGYNPKGVLGPPTVPATTVAYTNAYGLDCEVNVNGGTVTAVAIGGSATGRTSGPFTVPAGQTITLTYSAAPTWTWFGN
jgi:hypothetical protein